MKPSYNCDFIGSEEKKEMVGIYLGADFTSEHEWGIRPLHEAFGITGNALGLEGKLNTLVPKGLHLIDTPKTHALIFERWLDKDRNQRTEEILKSIIRGDLQISEYSRKELSCAWDEGSFGVRTIKERKEVLHTLYDAFQTKNGIITMGGNDKGNPFARAGLVLADYRKIPEEIRADVREKDRAYREEQANYRRLEQESGVFEALKAAKKEFFYLGVKSLDKKGNPRWWLNPVEQEIHNYGWYTTKQLLQWAEDKGPVMMKKKR